MPKVKFIFNKEKDLWNHWHKSNWKPQFANFTIWEKTKKICEGKEFEECKEELSIFLKEMHESLFINIHVGSVEKAWKNIEKEFFKRMDNVMKKKYDKDIIAYLTTLNICPYDPKEPSFMFSFFYPLLKCLQTCGHEIMHIYFHEFYWEIVEKEVGKEKTADFKEALTVLLNLEFKDLWFIEDKGYEMHNELRNFIKQEWVKEKDFDVLIKKCITYLNFHNLKTT